jgi:hypothetical protein
MQLTRYKSPAAIPESGWVCVGELEISSAAVCGYLLLPDTDQMHFLMRSPLHGPPRRRSNLEENRLVTPLAGVREFDYGYTVFIDFD